MPAAVPSTASIVTLASALVPTTSLLVLLMSVDAAHVFRKTQHEDVDECRLIYPARPWSALHNASVFVLAFMLAWTDASKSAISPHSDQDHRLQATA